jgi:hypothetical protein
MDAPSLSGSMSIALLKVIGRRPVFGDVWRI